MLTSENENIAFVENTVLEFQVQTTFQLLLVNFDEKEVITKT